ncbi:TolC family protein [Wenyingzhuangia sp. IMCC45533]
MKKRTLFLVIFFLTGFVSNGTSQTKKWSLKDCVQYAFSNNLEVKEQELNVEESKINTSNAKGTFLPNLNGGVRNTWNSGLSENPITGNVVNQRNRISIFNLSSNIPIYNGLKNYHTLQQSKLRELAAQYKLDKIKDDISLNIANSYLQVLLQKENINILKEQYNLTLEQLKRSEELVNAGSLPKGDLLQLKANAASDVQNIVEAENSYSIAKLGLKRLLNLDFKENLVITTEYIDIYEIEMLKKSVDSIVKQALFNRNEIKLFEKNVEISNKAVEVAKGDYLPAVSGFVNLNTSEINTSQNSFTDQLENNRGVSVGIDIIIPIFNGNRVKNEVARSKINVLKSKNQLAQTRQKLIQDISQVYLNAQGSYKTYQANQQTVLAQKQAFEYQQIKFDVGVINTYEFTQTKVAYQNSQTELARAKYDLLFSVKLLELYIGGFK